MSTLCQRWNLLLREYARRPCPHGLLGPGLLLQAGEVRARQHLRLWWRSGQDRPRLLWLLGEAWLWLRWSGFHAWRQSYWAASVLGGHSGGETARPKPRDFFRFLGLALWWGVPPHEVLRLGVHRRPAMALDYVYDLEAGAWGRLCGPGRVAEHSRRLLSDKIRCAEVLQAGGVPAVRTLHCLPQHRSTALGPHLGEELQAWFCKTRTGHAGQGAFEVWRQGDALRGRCLNGRSLPDSSAVERAWRELIERDDALVQPALRNHPVLAPLCDSEEAITVRLIMHGGSGPALLALLEIPAPEPPGSTARRRYVILPLDEQGRPNRCSAEDLPQATRAALDELCARLPDGFRVPHWPELLHHSVRAQALAPGLWAVAWDWVVTPEGPVLLEGNAGFGLSMLQTIHGGLLVKGDGVGN